MCVCVYICMHVCMYVYEYLVYTAGSRFITDSNHKCSPYHRHALLYHCLFLTNFQHNVVTVKHD